MIHERGLCSLTALLALVMLAAGALKLSKSKAELAESGQGWVESFSEPAIKGIGGLELLAAVGLVVPGLVGIATTLVPLAASGVVAMMVGAAATHGRRREYPNVVVNLVLGGIALTIAILRFGSESL